MKNLLVVGLGNPGPEYEKTRHNVGYMVVDELARSNYVNLSQHKKTNTMLGAFKAGETTVALMRARCFMNESGGPVKAVAQFFKLSPADILVVHDELDQDFGTVSLKIGGGNNGHNGLKSISKALGTPEFARLKCGIGRPPGRQEPRSFVLKPFSKQEQQQLPGILDDACRSIDDYLRGR
ncbi:aminoacyl-tRNA hydrolase [Corynebacterium aquilae]|uniref:Peptidyl-tRNA hydrolase n=1 Tax=Corynebacterium aquilae DSM 44791 TaxID=1431546 RepID=A0A1L7CFK6_9CORY|nr:aminoacyl-tRNA hydrolase [Corynebacterium aquilae]APT84615.1 peptidyl-tRNA hydrolase [Corynebacterium aquilae DSM 44791]